VDVQRSRLLASVGRALEAAEQAERQASQNSLFGEAEAPRGGAHVVVEAPAWDLKQKLMEEKAALGFTLSGHLFSVYEGLLSASRARRSPASPRPRAGSGWPARSPRCAAR
jgi:DNA polymerase-3 subunit alpha